MRQVKRKQEQPCAYCFIWFLSVCERLPQQQQLAFWTGLTNTLKANQTFKVVQPKETPLLYTVKGFGCWSRAVVCIQMILNAYWGLRNFVVLYACCSQKPLTQNSVLIFFPLNKSLTPTFLFSLNKLFTPPQNCDAHPRHVCCVWSIPSCFEGEEGDNNLVFSAIHAPILFSSI